MTDAEPGQRHPLRRLVNRLEVDRAVFFAVSTRGWQLLAGAVTMVLVTLFFSPEELGYYQLFFSLTAAQTFFELGFSIVITNLSSHEWSRLKLDEAGRPSGDEEALSRLVSLGRLVFKWYAVASVLFVGLVWLGGAAFIESGSRASVFLPGVPQGIVDWEAPWAWTVVLSGVLLWTLPFRAMLDGCGQIAVVQRFALIQAVVTNVAVWTAMSGGAALWTAVVGTAAHLSVDLVLLLVRYRRFFSVFVHRRPTSSKLRWTRDVWPMQWRLGVGGVFGYFAAFLFVPAMWHAHGPVVAGQMGLTWRLISTVQAAALAWVLVRVPRFGVLIQQQQYRELDRIFFRLSLISLGVVSAGALVVWGFVLAVNSWVPLNFGGGPFVERLTGAANRWVPRLAERLLDPLPVAVFCAAIVIYQIPQCMAFYVRAHKYEPFLKVNVLGSTAIGLSVWYLGAWWGPLGASWGYLAVVALLIVPIHTRLWQICRRRLHHAPAEQPAPQRIAVIVHSLCGGGAERVTADLARGWSKPPREVTLITLDTCEHDRYDAGPDVTRVGLDVLRHSANPVQAVGNNLRRLTSLRRAIQQAQPEVVVSLTDTTNVLTLLACVGTGQRVVICERTNPRVHDVGRMWSRLRRLTYPWAEALVVQTAGAREACREWMRGRPIYVIPNVCSPSASGSAGGGDFRRAEPDRRDDESLVVGMGRLDSNKGFDLLIDAFAQVAVQIPQWRLEIAGDGPEREFLDARIEQHGLKQRVTLTGWNSAPRELLARADLFVLASRYEGFPNVLLEALAAGVPVISFDCDFGPAEIVRHEVDGLLVPAGDVSALAVALAQLMSDDATREKYALRAVEVIERFGQARYDRQWEAVLSGRPERIVDAMNDSRDAPCVESPEF